ncbi:Histone acetyltransferase HAC5 [Cardamine amara subsp. amara]|uniref:histone acetyltransferase n=1 Tax=Cardamine amara subsp. amara TaxID=228776 RepID=A0ABD1BW94_CARAN
MNINVSHQNCPVVSRQQNSSKGKRRHAIQTRILAILLAKQPSARKDPAKMDQFLTVSNGLEDKLFQIAKSEEEYSDVTTLEERVEYLLNILREKKASQLRAAAAAAAAATATTLTSIGTNGGTYSTLDHNSMTANNTGGFYIRPPEQSSGAIYQMVDVNYRPNINQVITSGICSPIVNPGLGINRSNINVPLAYSGPMTSQVLFTPTHFSTFSKPPIHPVDQFQAMQRYSMSNADSFGSSNLYGPFVTSSGASMTVPLNYSNPMLRVDNTFITSSNHSNLQGMQQTPFPNHQLLHQLGNNNSFQSRDHLAQMSQQLLDRGFHQQARDIELYHGQPQNQDPNFLYKDAYPTHVAASLAAPVNYHVPNVALYKEALDKETTNGFKPSKLQYQQTPNSIGAQNVSVIHSSSTQLNSSPSLPPQPQQKRSASVMVERQSSLQKSTEISENNNGKREDIGVTLSPKATMKPEAVSCCSSAIAPTSSQTVISPKTTAEKKRLGDGNDTSSKQAQAVNIYCGLDCKKARKWILYMYHVHYCKETQGNCASKFCYKTKMLLRHIIPCKVPDCDYHNLCGFTRKCMLHYKHCKDESCPICVFVKNFKKKEREKRLLVCGAKCRSASLNRQPKESSEGRKEWNKRGTEALSVGDDDLQRSIKRLKIERPSQNVTPDQTGCDVVCKPHTSMNMHEKDALQSDDNKNVRAEVMPMHIDAVPDASRKLEKHVAEDGLQSDGYKSVKAEAMPMNIDVPVASRKPKKHVAEDSLQSDGYKSVRAETMPMNIYVPDVSRKLEKHAAEDTPKDTNGGGFAMEDKNNCLLAQEKPKCMNEMSAPKEEDVKQSMEVVDASKMDISSLVELFTPQQVKEHIRGLRQWVGQSKTKAEKNKAMGCSMSENSCQLCAVERLVFEPIPIYCSPCGIRIKRNALHYSVAAGESRQCVCTRCYNETRENSVSFDGTSIPKARLEKKKNDEQVGEAWVQCDKCEAWQHQICALFNSRRNHGEATRYTCPNCYIQEVEKGERRPLPLSAIPGAKDLPVTALSNHIEERLFKKLNKERQERARFQGKRYEEVPGAESLTVRVVASVDKVLEVKQSFLELFQEENYPSEFPYKSKVILLFQKIENVEVCLFGMFVQEFGTESGPPNQRRVYLSYLDSVKYFRPEVRTVSEEALRTFVYHEILIGYLDYCKKRGFTSCYIWACPPLKGEDYILYCHPEIQKTPKADKLREWYLAMLKKASKEDVVVECTNLYDHFFVQSGECRANVTASRLPYFDGDYWPGAAEDFIRQMSQEGDDDVKKLNRKGLNKNTISKRALRAAVGQLDLTVNASKDRLLMQKLGETICPLKEDFIMVHLQHSCKHCCTLMVSGNMWVCKQCKKFQICDKCNEVEQKRIEKERHPINQKEKHTLSPVAIKDVPIEIEDKDNNLMNEFFDNRQTFLNLCQGNNYQYDTLRRAKHSSMMILYHLHNPTAPAFVTICTICQQEVENAQGWHCQVCPGYDVCNACYSKASINHSHKLISRSSSKDTVGKQNGQTNQNDHKIQLEKIKDLMVHAVACGSTECKYKGCQRMKNLFRHCLTCKTGLRGCSDCKTFWNLVSHHARWCRDSRCTVPKCGEYRAVSNRKQNQLDKRRRAAVMEMMRERAVEATTLT